MSEERAPPQSTRGVALAVTVAALGYFVDIYDLILFGVVRKASLADLGVAPADMQRVGEHLVNYQMIGLVLGGVLWGVLGDRRGRLSVLFGSIIEAEATADEVRVAPVDLAADERGDDTAADADRGDHGGAPAAALAGHDLAHQRDTGAELAGEADAGEEPQPRVGVEIVDVRVGDTRRCASRSAS